MAINANNIRVFLDIMHFLNYNYKSVILLRINLQNHTQKLNKEELPV